MGSARALALLLLLVGGCVRPGEPSLKEPPLAALRPCFVPRADHFYFEKDWLQVKGRELDALKFGNALWWLGEASWNEAFDAREIYGPEQAIFGTLSRAPESPRPAAWQQARLLYLEERDEPLAPVLISLQSNGSQAHLHVRALSRGKPKDPGGAACWGGPVLLEQRPLPAPQAQPALVCARKIMEDRVRAEPWSPLPEDGRDAHYLLEYQDPSLHGLAQHSLLVSNIDGINVDKLRACHQHFLALTRKKPPIPAP
jgi:hypothetical protein